MIRAPQRAGDGLQLVGGVFVVAMGALLAGVAFHAEPARRAPMLITASFAVLLGCGILADLRAPRLVWPLVSAALALLAVRVLAFPL